MSGFDSPYVPGWDCHGLPIEIKVDQQLGGKKLQMDPKDVRLECRKYAQKFLDLQREQFKRIGVFGRFDDPYSTMTPRVRVGGHRHFSTASSKTISSTKACVRSTGASTTRLLCGS
jgi:isoleucyl-tRNA synthetase